MSAAKVRCLLLAVSTLLSLQSSLGLPATFKIDPKLSNVRETLPGLDGGAPRAIAVLAGPTGRLTEVVANEVLFHPRSDKELDAFLARYGGTILRDGMPIVTQPLPKGHPPLESDGWYLIRIDPSLSHVNDLEQNLGKGPLAGVYRFSSEEVARFFAIFLREQDLSIGPNLVVRGHAIPEHPNDTGGNLDASTFWWLMNEDNPAMPDGRSTGVIQAWDYLRYHQLPPANGTYRPARIAIIDNGFALEQTGDGLPLEGNLDFGFGMMQSDVVDQDGFAGSINLVDCEGGHVCHFHGQSAFGVAAAEPGNGFGAAGTGGRVVWPLLVRTGDDWWTLGDAVRTASISESDVISISSGGGCGDWDWVCRIPPDDIYSRMERAVTLARSWGQVVVASAGNAGVEISSDTSDPMPCNLAGVICVGGIGSDGMNDFNFGSAVDIWAPTHILSTVNPESRALDTDDIGMDEVDRFGGTSASAPFIAGVVGLMKVLDPAISPQSVLDILQATANSSPDPKVHRGYVDALRAVQAVRPNQPPVVQWAGPPSGTVAWTGASLTAQASDPEVSSQMIWQWPITVAFSSNIDGPLCSDSIPPYGCFSGPLTLGNHVVTATATDAFGATSSATRNFHAVNHPPAPDIAEPLANGTYFAHQPVTLEAFVLDPDELIPQNGVQWRSNLDGVLGTGWSRDQMLSAGAHVLTVIATDGQGATGQDSVTITVQPGAGLPSVQILQPGPGLSVTPGTSITLRGAATDPEDGVLTGASLVWFSDRDGLLGTGQTLNVVLSGPAVPCNPEIVTHVVRLRATDSDGHVVEVRIRISVGLVC